MFKGWHEEGDFKIETKEVGISDCKFFRTSIFGDLREIFVGDHFGQYIIFFCWPPCNLRIINSGLLPLLIDLRQF